MSSKKACAPEIEVEVPLLRIKSREGGKGGKMMGDITHTIAQVIPVQAWSDVIKTRNKPCLLVKMWSI